MQWAIRPKQSILMQLEQTRHRESCNRYHLELRELRLFLRWLQAHTRSRKFDSPSLCSRTTSRTWSLCTRSENDASPSSSNRWRFAPLPLPLPLALSSYLISTSIVESVAQAFGCNEYTYSMSWLGERPEWWAEGRAPTEPRAKGDGIPAPEARSSHRRRLRSAESEWRVRVGAAGAAAPALHMFLACVELTRVNPLCSRVRWSDAELSARCVWCRRRTRATCTRWRSSASWTCFRRSRYSHSRSSYASSRAASPRARLVLGDSHSQFLTRTRGASPLPLSVRSRRCVRAHSRYCLYPSRLLSCLNYCTWTWTWALNLAFLLMWAHFSFLRLQTSR